MKTSKLKEHFERTESMKPSKLKDHFESTESMKPSKLKDHFERSHVEFAEKDTDFFKRKEHILKSTRVDSTGHFAQISEAVTEASFRIAECKKPHTIGENRIKPCLVEATKKVESQR